MSYLNKCIECGTIFIKDEKYEIEHWFTCEICGTDYHKVNGKWEKEE